MKEYSYICSRNFFEKIEKLRGVQGLKLLQVSQLYSDYHFRLLADVLRENKTICQVWFSECTWGPVNSELIADMLKASTSVRGISITDCRSEDGSIATIAGALRVNESVDFLYIGFCKIGLDDAAALAGALEVNQTLRDVAFDPSRFEGNGRKLVADALKLNTGCSRVEF
jgi:hypothetical protein